MDTDSKELLQKILRDSGRSMTEPRRVVCELLWAREPQGMAELGRRAQGKLDRASLYRTVGLYEKLGIVQRIYVGWKYKVELSDVFSHHHHHLSCLDCGRIIAIKEDDKIERLIHEVAEAQDFEPQRHQLEIQGLCAACRLGQATK